MKANNLRKTVGFYSSRSSKFAYNVKITGQPIDYKIKQNYLIYMTGKLEDDHYFSNGIFILDFLGIPENF